MNLFCGTFRNHVLRPQRRLYLANVCLSQKEHADTRLTDTADNGERKLAVNNRLLIRQLRSFGAACLVKL